MGAFVSVPYCETHYKITPNCSIADDHYQTINLTEDAWPSNISFGGLYKGEFEGDPDIAGIGILAVFVLVTSFALVCSFVDVGWQAAKTFKWKRRRSEEEMGKGRRKRSVSDILETLVLSCSDQQVFTGAAYALTLRYWRGCDISAYHYNIVANMMLLTCATHLMSVTIVRNYWKYPLLAIIRILAISGVFIVTGLLFTNQNADQGLKFPTGVPPADTTDSLIFLPAACFQGGRNTATDTFRDSTKSAPAFFQGTLVHSTPNNFIQGWKWYVLILLFYGVAIVAEIIRFFRRGISRKGWRAGVGKKVQRFCGFKPFQRRLASFVFLIYLLAGVGISTAVVIMSTLYIFRLRNWVDKSGWIEIENNQNPENDPATFGQLVPIFTSAMIFFSFLQVLSEKITLHGNRKHTDEEAPPQDGTIQFFDPSNYDLLSPPTVPEKPATTEYFGAAGMNAASTPPRVDIDHQSSWGSTISMSNPKISSTHAGSPAPAGNGFEAGTPTNEQPYIVSPLSPRPGAAGGYTALPAQPGTAPSSPPSQHGSPDRSRASLPAHARPHIGGRNPSQQQLGPSRSSTQVPD
ncbi:hypothetical protein F5Y15DRAFT_172649 [Xylariaceae sp. FL0016]|nr:hypothetical protein F5Y15DRAFT_172649 [Xylariaceae sp. FL0016]